MPDLTVLNLAKFIVRSIMPTEKVYRKRDGSGNIVNNHFPGCFLVNGTYQGNENYSFIATDKELPTLQKKTETPSAKTPDKK